MFTSIFTPLGFATDFELITKNFSAAQKQSANLLLKYIQESGHILGGIKFPTIMNQSQSFDPEITLNTLCETERLQGQIEQVILNSKSLEQFDSKPSSRWLSSYPDCKDLAVTQQFVDYKAGDGGELVFKNVTQDFLNQIARAKCERLTLTEQSTSLNLDSMPHLKVLNISGSASISGAAEYLKKLNSDGCDLRTLKFNEMPNLKSLTIFSNKWHLVTEETTFTASKGSSLNEKAVYQIFGPAKQRTFTVFHVPHQVKNFAITCTGAYTLPDKVLFVTWSKVKTLSITAPKLSCELVNLEHLTLLKRMNVDASPQVVNKLPVRLKHLVIDMGQRLKKKDTFDFVDWQEFFAGENFPQNFTIKGVNPVEFCGDARIKCGSVQVLQGSVF